MTACTVRLANSAAHSSSSWYSEVKGQLISWPGGASRRSLGSRSRSEVTRVPAGVLAVPAEQCAELPPGLPHEADDERGTVWKVVRSDLQHQPRELVRAAWRRQRPYILDGEVGG